MHLFLRGVTPSRSPLKLFLRGVTPSRSPLKLSLRGVTPSRSPLKALASTRRRAKSGAIIAALGAICGPEPGRLLSSAGPLVGMRAFVDQADRLLAAFDFGQMRRGPPRHEFDVHINAEGILEQCAQPR